MTPARRRPLALWGIATAGSLGIFELVGALGDSAAVPGLGPGQGQGHRTPPWDLAAHPPAWLVTVLPAVAYLLGAVAVLAGLRALAAGWRPRRPGRLLLAGAGLAVLATLVPPAGSADHLSYVAYGRIAAAGDDPYAVVPIEWHGGHDPVAGAVAPPWQRTPSVYGPVATALQALPAVGGGGSLRLTVWWWQLISAAAFVAVGFVVDRLAGPDPGRRARAAVVWTLNPLLLGQLVFGAHLDVVAAAFGIAGLALAVRGLRTENAPDPVRSPGPGRSLGAGLLLGAAVATKAPYALFALAALWGLRGLPRARLAGTVTLGAAGALAVVVPAHLWAGPHVFDQLGHASRFTSLASPWRGVANLGDLALGHGAVNQVATYLALALAAGFAVLLWRRVATLPATCPGDEPAADGVRAALVLTLAWVLLAPYALPWYDAMVWAPLALVGPSLLDAAVAGRLTVLALAYLPGRVVGLPPTLESLTLGFRGFVAPAVVLGVIVVILRWSLAGRRPAGLRPARWRLRRS